MCIRDSSTNAYRYLTSELTESLDFSSRKEERGAGGGTAWRMNAVPSPCLLYTSINKIAFTLNRFKHETKDFTYTSISKEYL